MASEEYMQAYKAAMKEVRNNKGSLTALEQILPAYETMQRQRVGMMEIPLSMIAGSCHASRNQSFTNNFLPVMSPHSEFAAKWSKVYQNQVEYGIDDPILVVEYRHRFYVEEGNKRVSVFHALQAPVIMAEVYRIKDGEDPTYDAFLNFFEVCPIYEFDFSYPEGYQQLLDYIHVSSSRMTNEAMNTLKASYYRFQRAYHLLDHKLPEADAFLVYLSIYRYESLLDLKNTNIIRNVRNIENEFTVFEQQKETVYESAQTRTTLLSRISKYTNKKLKIAFVHQTTAQQSQYVLDHEIGISYIQQVYGDSIQTDTYLSDEVTADILSGYQVVFVDDPDYIQETILLAATCRNTQFFHCSNTIRSSLVIGYAGKTFETMFLLGMCAGMLTKTDQIGYIIQKQSVPNEINAFAKGAALVNPYALIQLYDCVDEIDEKTDCCYLSDYPHEDTYWFGLCMKQNDDWIHYAGQIHHWGHVYQRMIEKIMSGSWQRHEPESIQCWWGLKSDMIDLILSSRIPSGNRELIRLMKQQIKEGTYDIFHGLDTEEILTMNSYINNVKEHV